MQEVFEKIIEKFKEIGDIQFSSFSKPLISVDDAIEIVKQTAEEHRNGWIPCSERLPEKEMIVWVSFTNPYARYVKKARYSHDFNDNGNKMCFKWENGAKIKNQPVAWKPYYAPEPYQPKGE